MPAFRLPRLKANLAIVNGQGKPLDYFLRFWNIEVAPRIEQQEANQDDLIAQIQAVQQEQADQLALIIAAQARADEAYNLAADAQGSRYIDFSGTFPEADGVLNNQTSDSKLSFSGDLNGATIDADTAWNGTLTFTEENGGAPVVMGSISITVSSNGLNLGGEWQTDAAPFSFETVGTLAGTVTYTVEGAYTSGANFVMPPTINVTLTTLPMAS